MAAQGDFAFGFDNENYSDRVLVLAGHGHDAKHKSQSSRKRKAASLDENEGPLKKLRVSSLLLAGKSEFFQALFKFLCWPRRACLS